MQQASIGATHTGATAILKSLNPIPDRIKELGVISCDLCGKEKASFDAFVEGMVDGVPLLKRCCDVCARSLSPRQ